MGVNADDLAREPHLGADLLELPSRTIGEPLVEAGQQPVHRFDENDSRPLVADSPKVIGEHEATELNERAGDFDPRRTAADDYEREKPASRFGVALPFGGLEGEQHAAPDFETVLHRLEPEGMATPVLVTEEVRLRPVR